MAIENDPFGKLKGKGIDAYRAKLDEESLKKKEEPSNVGRLKINVPIKKEGMSSSALLTDKIEFGNFGAGVGNLDSDGFSSRISNNMSGQDAIAISADRKTFVVADGLGGAGGSNSTTVTKWSRAIAEAVALLPDIKTFSENETYLNITKAIKENFEKEGLNLKSIFKGGKTIGIKTTLSAAQRIGLHEFRILTIGDSPIYIIDKKSGRIIKQYGEDIMRGGTDAPLKSKVGMNDVGEIVPLENKEYIVNEMVTVNPGELLVIASDYFSDFTYVGGNLNDYINLNSQDFHIKVTSEGRAKGDDATLVVIDPDKLK